MPNQSSDMSPLNDSRPIPTGRRMPRLLEVGCLLAVLVYTAPPALAHPVAFKGASQLMLGLSEDRQSFELYHSYTARQAFGIHAMRFDYDDFEDIAVVLQHNWLVHRWNLPAAQANFYTGIGAGYAEADPGSGSLAGLGFARFDYETRRVYCAVESKFFGAADFTRAVNMAAVGFAPYKAEFDDLNTWLILKAENVTESPDDFMLIPEVRFFWKNYFLELGVSTDGDFRVQFMVHF